MLLIILYMYIGVIIKTTKIMASLMVTDIVPSSTVVVRDLKPDMENAFRELNKLFNCLLESSMNSKLIKTFLKNCLESLSNASDTAERHLYDTGSSVSMVVERIGIMENEMDDLEEEQNTGSLLVSKTDFFFRFNNRSSRTLIELIIIIGRNSKENNKKSRM